MALSVSLITTTDASGATTIQSIYLTNSTNAPTPSGNPLVESQTPYSINARNWTPTAAPRQTIYSGGPPFRIGSLPLLVGFDNVTETVEIGIAANTVDDMITLIQRLRRALNAAIIGVPAVLVWQPNGAANPTCFEIYSADVQEVGDWQNPAAGFTNVLCRVTWTRSAFGGRLAAGEPLITSLNVGPAGFVTSPMGSNRSGDLRHEGQPTNVRLALATPGADHRFFVGTVATEAANSGPAAISTTSTTGVDVRTLPFNAGTGFGLVGNNAAGQYRQQRIRLLLVVTINVTAGNIELQLNVRSAANNATRHETPWINPNIAPSGSGTRQVTIDFGDWNPAAFRNTNSVINEFSVQIRMRSTDGLLASATYDTCFWLPYYTWAQVDSNFVFTADVIIDSFRARPNFAALPLAQPFVGAQSRVSNRIDGVSRLRGVPPVFIEGAQCFVAWGSTANANNESILTSPGFGGALTLSVTHAPLYTTMRGAG